MSLSVVVVDDSALARKQLIRSLPEDWDVEIREAKNGQEGLAAFREGVDLMFLDLTMPDMDGFEVLETIASEWDQYLVIVVSADVQNRAVERVKDLGALAFVGKPVDGAKIRQTLEEYGLI